MTIQNRGSETMSACIDTNITMKGSLEELLDMIKVLEDSKL